METLFNLFSEDFQYISTNRISPNITYPLSELNIEKNLIGIKGEYTAHYLAVNRHQSLKINKLIHPSSKTNQLLENVSLWLGEISNGIDISAKVYNELQQVNLTYNYIYGDNKSNEFTPLNVGFGITYVLPIIVAVLKSKPDDLLIIENPESHLHPAGQSKIAELCALASSQGVQIIIETHSDHFLNGIRVATKKEILKPESSQIYYFRKEKNELETKIDKLNIDKNGKIDEWPIGFFDEWDNKLDELLW
jgi:predicted ATPase